MHLLVVYHVVVFCRHDMILEVACVGLFRRSWYRALVVIGDGCSSIEHLNFTTHNGEATVFHRADLPAPMAL